MAKTYQLSLDGVDFTVTKLTNRERLRIQKPLAKVVGPVLVAANSRRGEGDANVAEMLSAPGALDQLTDTLDEIEPLFDVFIKKASFDRNGKTVAVSLFEDEVFSSERPLLVYKFLIACVREDFGSFLDAAGLSLSESQATETTE